MTMMTLQLYNLLQTFLSQENTLNKSHQYNSCTEYYINHKTKTKLAT